MPSTRGRSSAIGRTPAPSRAIAQIRRFGGRQALRVACATDLQDHRFCGCEDTLNTLDPRSPLVLDVHELGRRAGAMLKRSFTAPAPVDLGSEVIGIPEGSDIEVQLRLESVIEGVLVSGSAEADATGECARCLAAVDRQVVVDFQELYEYPETGEPGDEEALRLEGDLLDLEPVLRDALVLSLPLAPLCREDCRGLCLECGADLNLEPGHEHETVDARWQKLTQLLQDDDSKEG